MNKRIKKKQQTMDLKKRYKFAKRHGYTHDKFEDWKQKQEVVRNARRIFGSPSARIGLGALMEVARMMRFGRY